MIIQFLIFLSLILTFYPVSSSAAQDEAVSQGEPAQILVVGQRPGPGLWKIFKGEHVLWVFGTYEPLPKKLEWRSQQVEDIIASSQEYLSPPVATTDVGFFQSIALIPFAIGFKKNPDGMTLKDVLPAEVYERWLPLKNKYIGDDNDIERERPIFAADDLYRKALEQAGLSSGKDVRNKIEKIVRKNNVKMTQSVVKLAVDSPSRVIRDFKNSSMDDAACFSTTLTRLETDIDAMRVRANAWAKGDLDEIEKLSYSDQERACKTALTNSAALKELPAFQSMDLRMRDLWVANAESALAANSSTFALLPMKEILDEQGDIQILRSKGYLVQSLNSERRLISANQRTLESKG
jgi:hypothetical protein